MSAGDTVIDCGAGNGEWIAPLAVSVGDNGRIIAVDENKVLFGNLCATVILNSLVQVRSSILYGDCQCVVLMPPGSYEACALVI